MIASVLLASLVAFTAAYALIRHAERLDLVKAANERSSHTKPTPRGGGLGIALGGALAGIFYALQGLDGAWVVVALSLAFAALGFLDDMRDLSSKLRFLVQVLLVGAFLAVVYPLPPVVTPLAAISGPLLLAGLLLAGVWWINLFNFMDGIDGIAACQGIVMLAAGATLAAWGAAGAANDPLWWWMWAIAAATGGFLLLNWAPARIFMGDVGSNYLAFMILALALMTISAGRVSYASWAILAAAFVSDTTVTLFRRIRNGERWFTAHRRHAFQFLARQLKSHALATLAFVAVNVLYLVPLAFWAQARPDTAWLAALTAYLPLMAVAWLYGAGKPE